MNDNSTKQNGINEHISSEKSVYFDNIDSSKQIDLNEDECEKVNYTGFDKNENSKTTLKKQKNQLEYPKLQTNFTSPTKTDILLNKKRNKSFEEKCNIENTQPQNNQNQLNQNNLIQNSEQINTNEKSKIVTTNNIGEKKTDLNNLEIKNIIKSIKQRHGDNKMIIINTAIYLNVIEILNENIIFKDSKIEGKKYIYRFLKTNRDDKINLKKKEIEKRLEQTVEEIVSDNIAIQQKNNFNLDNNKILCEKIKKEKKETIILELFKIPFYKFYEDFKNGNCLKELKEKIPKLVIPESYITKEVLIKKYEDKKEINESIFKEFIHSLNYDFKKSINNKNYEFYTRHKFDISLYNKLIEYLTTKLFKFFNETDRNQKYYPINKKDLLNIEYYKNKKENKESHNIINITFKDPYKPIAETILSLNIALSLQKQLKIDKDHNKNLFKNNKNEIIKELSEYSFRDYIFYMMRKGEKIDEKLKGLKIVDFISEENFYKYINEENDVYINDLKFLSENYDTFFKLTKERPKIKKKGKKEDKIQNEE